MIGNLEIQQHGKECYVVPHKPTILATALLLSLYTLILIWVSTGGMSRNLYWNLQVDWFLKLNQQLSSFPIFWHNVTKLGDAAVLLPILSFTAVFRPIVWAAIFGSIPLATILTHGGKWLAAGPRPAAVLDQSLFTIVDGALKGENSLPSGHSATVFVAGTVIMLVLFFTQQSRGRWLVLSTILAISTTLAISRIAVGAHWPLDVLLGAVCGYLGGLSGIVLAQRHTQWWSWIKQPYGQLVQGLILMVWSLSLIIANIDEPTHMTMSVWLATLMGLFTSSIMLSEFYTSKFLSQPPVMISTPSV